MRKPVNNDHEDVHFETSRFTSDRQHAYGTESVLPPRVLALPAPVVLRALGRCDLSITTADRSRPGDLLVLQLTDPAPRAGELLRNFEELLVLGLQVTTMQSLCNAGVLVLRSPFPLLLVKLGAQGPVLLQCPLQLLLPRSHAEQRTRGKRGLADAH